MSMKLLYTILFFADLVGLVKLSYLFLVKIDSGRQPVLLIVLVLGIAVSIALLIYFLSAYINLPVARRQR